MGKKVNVKPYLRGGRPVVGHERTVAELERIDGNGHTGAVFGMVAGVAGLADDIGEVSPRVVSGKVFGAASPRVASGKVFGQVELLMDDSVKHDFNSLNNESDPVGVGAADRFDGCAFSNVVFRDVNLVGREFVGCSFSGCEFAGVDLSDVTFQDCDFGGTVFAGVDVQSEDSLYDVRPVWNNVSFDKCSFRGGYLEKVTLAGGGFSDCSLQRFDWKKGLRLHGSAIKDCKFEGGTIDNAELSGSVFERCEFDSIRFYQVGHGSPGITKPGVSQVEFRDSVFLGVELRGCDFKGSGFAGSRFDSSSFSQNRFSETDFSNTVAESLTVDESSFDDADLSSCQWEKIRFDGSYFSMKNTKWKDARFDVEFAWRGVGSGYEQHTLTEALATSGLSEKQFEFVVLSGAVEVRDNHTLKKITAGFDPDENHVPPWVYQNLHKFTDSFKNRIAPT